MARKDWFYIPLPSEMLKALDEVMKEAHRYGIADRAELIRMILGDFITRYDRYGKSLAKTRKLFNNNCNINSSNNH